MKRLIILITLLSFAFSQKLYNVTDAQFPIKVTIGGLGSNDGSLYLKDGTGADSVQFTDDGTNFKILSDNPWDLSTQTISDLGIVTTVDINGGTINGITDLVVADGGTGAGTFTDGGLLVGATTGALEAVAVGLTTQVLVGGGAGTNPAWGTDLPTAVTIGAAYVYRVSGTDVAVADGGTGASTLTDFGVLLGSGTAAITPMTALGAGEIIYGVAGADPTALAAGATTTILVGGGAAAPVWTTATGTGAPVRATSPTLVTPVLGAATATSYGGITEANLVDKSAVEAITGDWTFDGNHPVEGYATGRNVLRSIRILIKGLTDETTLSCEAFDKFNGEALAIETIDQDTPTGGTRFDIDAAGTLLTIKGLSQTVIVNLVVVAEENDSGVAFYTFSGGVSAGDITIEGWNSTTGAAVDFTNHGGDLPNGKTLSVRILYATSS